MQDLAREAGCRVAVFSAADDVTRARREGGRGGGAGARGTDRAGGGGYHGGRGGAGGRCHAGGAGGGGARGAGAAGDGRRRGSKERRSEMERQSSNGSGADGTAADDGGRAAPAEAGRGRRRTDEHAGALVLIGGACDPRGEAFGALRGDGEGARRRAHRGAHHGVDAPGEVGARVAEVVRRGGRHARGDADRRQPRPRAGRPRGEDAAGGGRDLPGRRRPGAPGDHAGRVARWAGRWRRPTRPAR